MWPRPALDLLPEPAAPDPADYTACQTLAAVLLPADEAALDQAGLDLLALSAATTDGETGMDSLGLDLAAGAVELDALMAEAEAEDLTQDLSEALSLADFFNGLV